MKQAAGELLMNFWFPRMNRHTIIEAGLLRKDGLQMILSAEALSPAQKSVIEQILGRQILEAEAISLRALAPPQIESAKQHAAAEKLRMFLEQSDRPRAGVSDEEFEAAILEALRSERPEYTPVP
jgi:hypothetical protein